VIKREHYSKKDGEWKPKQKFETESEALSFIKKHKMYKYTAYICKVCGKWHIGIKQNKNI
jgi:rubrerythrin